MTRKGPIMEAVIQILSGLIMHTNPVGISTWLITDQFVGIIQVGVILMLVGLVMIGLTRTGFPYRQAVGLAVTLVLPSSTYLVAHGGNPFGFAEKA